MVLVNVEGRLGVERGVERDVVFHVAVPERFLVEVQARFDAQQTGDFSGEGVEGVICGRAIYCGALDFAAAQEKADELGGAE